MRADNYYPYLLSAPNFYQHMRMRMQLTKNPYLRMWMRITVLEYYIYIIKFTKMF
jgi:hypothetical protein